MTNGLFLKKLRGKIVTFAADQNGAVLPFVAGSIVAMLAFATLATDVSRYVDLQTQLQKAADAFALAAAAELDGTATAETRATAAITTLMATVPNSSVFGAGAVTVDPPRFYSALQPGGDVQPMALATRAANPAVARFVEVVVTPVTITTFFPATIFGAAANTMAATASAVAGGPSGAGQVICGQTPIYVCSGAAGSATDMMNSALAPAGMRGREVSLVAAPGAGYSPGNYGFLDAANCGNSTPCLEIALAANNNGSCNSSKDFITTPGQRAAAGRYFDTRFDLYVTDAKNADKTVYSPDVNVRKGYLLPGPSNPDKCKQARDTTATPPTPPGDAGNYARPLPNDSDINSPYAVKIGNGNWKGKFDLYWITNFSFLPFVANPCPLATCFPTRFALYNYEIANGLVPHSSSPLPPPPPKKAEIGTPVCAPPANARADRRILYAAVVDCTTLGGGQTPVTAKGLVRFFLLQPLVQTGGFGTMLAEYVDRAAPNSNPPGNTTAIYDLVQLYR